MGHVQVVITVVAHKLFALLRLAAVRYISIHAYQTPCPPGGGPGLVWVNTETHVYHKEGSRFYGTTKKGKYVSEADAIKEGDRAAARGQ